MPDEIQPRRDENQVAWCRPECVSCYRHPDHPYVDHCAVMDKWDALERRVNMPGWQCYPAARRDAAELATLRTAHAQLTAAVEVLEAMRKRAQAYLNPGYADTAITVAVRWILTGTTGDGAERG